MNNKEICLVIAQYFNHTLTHFINYFNNINSFNPVGLETQTELMRIYRCDYLVCI